MRYAEINRQTSETDIRLTLNLDGDGTSKIDTGCGFLDHMLTLFARHGRFDLTIACKGDTRVDAHHTVEDVGLVLSRFCFPDLLKSVDCAGLLIWPKAYLGSRRFSARARCSRMR